MSILTSRILNFGKNGFLANRCLKFVNYSSVQGSIEKSISIERNYSTKSIILNRHNNGFKFTNFTCFNREISMNNQQSKPTMMTKSLIQPRTISTTTKPTTTTTNEESKTPKVVDEQTKKSEKTIKTISITNVAEIPATIRHRLPGNPIDPSSLTIEGFI